MKESTKIWWKSLDENVQGSILDAVHLVYTTNSFNSYIVSLYPYGLTLYHNNKGILYESYNN